MTQHEHVASPERRGAARLQGKVAVITGPGSGMGLAMATRFAAEGASVDLAALALFLASDESRHVNGAIIPADGGWTAA